MRSASSTYNSKDTVGPATGAHWMARACANLPGCRCLAVWMKEPQESRCITLFNAPFGSISHTFHNPLFQKPCILL
ncbi:rCG25301 [Rattus norvegicus]|uniref:RCG25301 n=1 Tax=Rattus norvegicus TaxID=10116 RepID=A6I1M9_RAT|nr:rCG25301 [Rattus norvegicus]